MNSAPRGSHGSFRLSISTRPGKGVSQPLVHEDPGADPSSDDADVAAATSDEFAWRGIPLQPFTATRAGIFFGLRLAMGAPPLHRTIDDVDAFQSDSHRILWLSLHTPADWVNLRSSAIDLQVAIDQWADENISGSEAPAAVLVAAQIYAASRRPPVAGEF